MYRKVPRVRIPPSPLFVFFMAVHLTLPARPPFSLSAVAVSHGWHQLAPFTYDPDTQTLTYIDRLTTGRVIELIITPDPAGVIVTSTDDLKPEETQQIEKQVTWMLGLDLDLSEFHTLARQETRLQRVVKDAAGQILRSTTIFEDLVKTILTTNTTWAGTIRMNRNLVNQFGDPLPGDSIRRAFPTPAVLAGADVETLRSKTKLGYRASYIHALAQVVEDSSLDLNLLIDGSLPTDELRRYLLAIKGIGPYAAANLLLLLGRYDDLPIDSWALKMVSREWFAGEPIGPAEVNAAFERWGTWRGLVYWFWEWENRS